MSAATTVAPSRTKTLTDALPIPEPAPVITATFSSSSPIMHLLIIARSTVLPVITR